MSTNKKKIAKKMAKKITAAMAKKLSQIYYSPSHPASFSTVNKLWLATGKKIPKKIVIEWLQSQDTYTLHRPKRLNFQRNSYLITNIDDLWECDLAVFSEDYSSENKDMKYLLG